MMTKRLVVAALAFAFALPVFAQKEPAEVNDGEIAKYKTSAENECRAGAAGKGDPKDVAQFCGCIFASLNKTMTRPEWQQAYFYSQKGEAARVREVLNPHLKTAECRPQAAAAAQPPAESQSAPPQAQPQAKPKLKVQ
jgi:hypothetical protein